MYNSHLVSRNNYNIIMEKNYKNNNEENKCPKKKKILIIIIHFVEVIL